MPPPTAVITPSMIAGSQPRRRHRTQIRPDRFDRADAPPGTGSLPPRDGRHGTGTTLRWFRSVFGDGLTYEQLIAEGAEVEPGSNGLLCFPYVEGATVPIQDDTARAVYYGIGGHHRRAHFTRSTLEGIAYQYPALLDVVRTRGLPGRAHDHLRR